MDQPLFNPNENVDQITPEAQDNSLNLNSLSQSKGNSNFITTPSDSPQIQTPQLINDESNSKVKKGKIYLSDLNTFCIPIEECIEKYIPIMVFCFATLFVIIGILGLIFDIFKNKDNDNDRIICCIAFIIGGFFFIALSILISYNNDHTVYFIMGENSITILIKCLLRKKEIIYNSGEIEKVKFQKTKKDEKGYFYKLEIISKKKGNKIIFSKDYYDEFFTNEEIDNFLCQINAHIETKM